MADALKIKFPDGTVGDVNPAKLAAAEEYFAKEYNQPGLKLHAADRETAAKLAEIRFPTTPDVAAFEQAAEREAAEEKRGVLENALVELAEGAKAVARAAPHALKIDVAQIPEDIMRYQAESAAQRPGSLYKNLQQWGLIPLQYGSDVADIIAEPRREIGGRPLRAAMMLQPLAQVARMGAAAATAGPAARAVAAREALPLAEQMGSRPTLAERVQAAAQRPVTGSLEALGLRRSARIPPPDAPSAVYQSGGLERAVLAQPLPAAAATRARTEALKRIGAVVIPSLVPGASPAKARALLAAGARALEDERIASALGLGVPRGASAMRPPVTLGEGSVGAAQLADVQAGRIPARTIEPAAIVRDPLEAVASPPLEAAEMRAVDALLGSPAVEAATGVDGPAVARMAAADELARRGYVSGGEVAGAEARPPLVLERGEGNPLASLLGPRPSPAAVPLPPAPVEMPPLADARRAALARKYATLLEEAGAARERAAATPDEAARRALAQRAYGEVLARRAGEGSGAADLMARIAQEEALAPAAAAGPLETIVERAPKRARKAKAKAPEPAAPAEAPAPVEVPGPAAPEVPGSAAPAPEMPQAWRELAARTAAQWEQLSPEEQAQALRMMQAQRWETATPWDVMTPQERLAELARRQQAALAAAQQGAALRAQVERPRSPTAHERRMAPFDRPLPPAGPRVREALSPLVPPAEAPRPPTIAPEAPVLSALEPKAPRVRATLAQKHARADALPRDRSKLLREILEASGIDDTDFARADAAFAAFKARKGPKPGPWTGGEIDALLPDTGPRPSGLLEAFERVTRKLRTWRDIRDNVLPRMHDIPGLERARLPDAVYERHIAQDAEAADVPGAASFDPGRLERIISPMPRINLLPRDKK